MAYKFTKAEAYSRTNKIVVEIPETFESQFLFNHLNKIGSCEGQNYWNCFDVYEVGNVRFLYGNFSRESKDFSSKLLKEVGLKARDIWNNAFHNDIYISSETRVNEIKKLAEDFATSIEKGIHDPGPIKSFVSFKKELLEQHKMFPDKPLFEIASELTKCIVNDEAKQKVNIGISKAKKNLNLDNVDKLDITELDLSLQGNLKHPINIKDLSKDEKINVYKDVFEKDVILKQFFVQVEYYNPSSHENDWCIVSNDNKETLGEENAKLFDTKHQAKLWSLSDEGKKWLPCKFEIKESVYSYNMDKVVMNKVLENIVEKAEKNIKKENQQTREI